MRARLRSGDCPWVPSTRGPSSALDVIFDIFFFFYQAINKMIDEQLGRRIRLHFRLIRCKQEFITSLNGVREYITKQKMRAQEAKEADG